MPDKATIFLEEKLEFIFDALEISDFKLAKHLIRKVSKKYPRHYLVSYANGLYAGFLGEHSVAIDSLQKSINAYPTYAMAHYNLAINYQSVNRLDLAIKHHKAALECATAEELEVIGASTEIIKSFEANLPQGLSLQAYFADAEQFEKAFALMHEKKYDKAFQLFKSIIGNQPKHVQSYGNSGICLMYLNDLQSCRYYLEKALEIDPDYEPAKGNLAILDDLETGVLHAPPEMVIRNFYAEKISK